MLTPFRSYCNVLMYMFSLVLYDRSITNSCIALCSSACGSIPQDLHIRFVLHVRAFSAEFLCWCCFTRSL